MNTNGIIVIEGSGDRVGKETQSKLLAKRFKDECNIEPTLMHFPLYDDPGSIPVKEYLKGNLGNVNDKEVSLLYAFDRSVGMRVHNIDPTTGLYVFDRYYQSNLIYSSAKRHVDNGIEPIITREDKELFDYIEHLEIDLLGIPKASDVVFLYVPWEIAKDNLKDGEITGDKSGSDINERNTALMKMVNELSYQIAELYGWHIIECTDNDVWLDRKKIADMIWESLNG